MPEIETGVISESPTEAIAVNDESENQQVAQTEPTSHTQGDVQTESVVEVTDLSAVGEDGVPIQNREYEWKRKHEQLVERLPEYIDQAVKEAAKVFQETSQQSQQKKFSEQELNAILYDDLGNYTAGNKVWAKEQLDGISEAKLSRLLDEKFNLSKRQYEEKALKSESEQYVVKTFPEMFKRDVNGRVVGWDTTNPMTQLTAKYMEKLGNRPDAVREAARQAYVDYSLTAKNKAQSKTDLAKSEAAQVKRNQIAAGGGNADVNALQSQVSEAFEKFKASGSVGDAKVYNSLKGRLTAVQTKG